MTYHGVEFSFNKRMSNGWQLGGSVMLTSHKGNMYITRGAQQSRSAFTNPNYYVNRYGDLPYSRPLTIKLFGTFTLPYRFLVSFFYVHTDGAPWGRTVTVAPPAAWAKANNARTWSYSIQVEPPGSSRDQASENVDLRVEKELSFGKYGTLGVFVDVFNVFGQYQIITSKDPGGTWKPVDANTTAGTYSPGWTGLTGHSGQRVFKFSIRYRF